MGNIVSSNSSNSRQSNTLGGLSASSVEQAEILQCLYKSSYESHRRRVREPVEGTCTWVTEHPKYREWVGSNGAGVLWLSADPGCGKSVMASFLVGHLKTQTGAIMCYFFFKDDSEEQRSATFALCAILHQLFSQRNSLYRYAEEALKAKGKRFTEEVDTLWDIFVKAVAEGGCGDVICVVDALDECEEETLAPLIRHVTRLPGSQTSDTSLRFLVTSRPCHKIEREICSPVTTIRLKGEDEADAVTADVTRVIDEGIENLESYWGRSGGLGYLRNLLESYADRTFLWVSLVLGILKDSGDDSPDEFTNIVATAPRDLAELYTKILDKARRILNIVVAATRPLTVRELDVAFRVRREHNSIQNLGDPPSGFEKTVKDLCGLFVRVIDSKIYLVYQTAREFLIQGSSSGQGNWQYTLSLNDAAFMMAAFMMADICISYLSQEEFAGSPLAVDTYGKVSEEVVIDYLQKYCFLDYAVRHWGDHFRDSQDQGMELFELTRLICEGRSGHCLTWFQVYWFNTQQLYKFPKDFTHLMIASLLGQGTVVDRLLEEGRDINAQTKVHGTALNIAAVQKDEGVARKLLQKNVTAYLRGKEYNILHMKKSEVGDSINSSDNKGL